MRKVISKVIPIILLICLLSGCAPTPAGCDGTSAPAVTGTVSGAVTGSAVTTSPDSTADSGFDIETTGGAVLVGSIQKDDAGLYLAPETPLDINCTDTSGNAYAFSGVTAVRLASSLQDIEYLGSIVTVSGRLRAEQGGRELYIYPYKIDYGKRAAASCAAPDLEASSGESDVYEPGRPLPEKMRLTVKDGVYVYNPYALSTAALRYMGSDFADFYVSFIDAYLNYETSIPCPSRRYADMLLRILEYEFPLYGAELVFDTLTFYDPASGTVRWSYNTDSRAAHDALVESFYAEANEFLGGAATGMGEKELAMTVYHNITTRVKYDYDILRAGYVPAYHPSYRAYHEHTGICSTFARTYAQMLTQVGVTAELCATDMRGEIVGHAWVIASINGSNYFFDPTYELSTTAGQGYVYFGMTLATRLSGDRRIIKDTIAVGTYDAKPVDEVVLSMTVLPLY